MQTKKQIRQKKMRIIKLLFISALFISNFMLNAQIIVTANVLVNCIDGTNNDNGTIIITNVNPGIAPYTYLWNNGATTHILNNVPNGIYTVTVTDANNLTGTNSFTMFGIPGTPPVQPIASGNPAQCVGDKYGVINTSDNPTLNVFNDYLWWTSTMVNGMNAFQIFPFPTTGGSISFTALDPNTGCSSTSNPLYIYPCCTGDFNFSNFNSTQITNNPPQGLIVTQVGNSHHISQQNLNDEIAINGTFTINNEIVFDNCHFIMGPNADINVHNVLNTNFVATFSKCTLNTCNNEYMWRGIHGDPGAGIEFSGESVIEQAECGINVDNANFIFDNSVINACHIGAIIENCAQSNLSYIRRMQFRCNDLNTNLPSTLIVPFAAQRTVSGLQILNSPFVRVGNNLYVNLFFRNTFSNLNNGVYIHNSNVDLFNNIFEDIQRYDFAGTGIAIEATGSPTMSVNIGGQTNNNISLSNSFTRCRLGIHAHHSPNITVGFNNFTDIRNTLGTFDAGLSEIAIQVNNLKLNFIRINDNTFNNFETGVKVGTYNDCQIQIQNNTFNSTVLTPFNEAAHGVLVNNPFTNSPQPIAVSIVDNYFHHCRNGVHLNVCDFADVDNNIITFYDADITGPNANLTRYGIRASGGFGLHTINHNWIRKPGNTPPSNLKSRLFGINVQSTENNFVQNNLVEKTGTGIRFFNTSIINSLLCNNMDGNRFGLRLENANIGNQGSLTSTQDNTWSNITFDVEGLGTLFPTSFYAQSSAQPWTPPFGNSVPINAYSYPSGSTLNNCDVFYPQPLRDQILGIVNQDGDFNLLTPEEQYASNQVAFEKLHTDSSLMNKGDADDAVLQNYHDSIAATNIGQLANGVTLNNSNLSSISPVNNAEENMKTLLGIYAVTWGIDIFDFTTQQFDALYNIASQNPITGGNAVYATRGMLHKFFDDDMMANGKLIHPVRLINLKPYKKGKLYPNPANDFAYYSIRLKKDEICTVQLIDLSGKILSSASNKNENCLIPIQTTNLSHGIYCVRILINGMICENHKLVKQ